LLFASSTMVYIDIHGISCCNTTTTMPPLTLLSVHAQEWSLKFTNKLERRVVGFVITSGGTSLEQKGGVSSKGSGVSGKSADALIREQLGNYGAGGMYSDE
jgi:hypothetical protein